MWTSADIKVHSILTEPPGDHVRFVNVTGREIVDEIDRDEQTEFAQFFKKVMKRGTYVIQFTPLQLLPAWSDLIRTVGFHTIRYPYVVVTDPSTIQQRPILDHPQELAQFLWSQ